MLKFNKQEKTLKEMTEFQLPKENEVIWFHFRSTKELPQEDSYLNIHPLSRKLFSTYSDFPKVNILKNEAVISLFFIKRNYQPVKVTILVNNQMVLSHSNDQDNDFISDIKTLFMNNESYMEQPGLILFYLINRISEYFLTAIDDIADEIQSIEKRVFKVPFENEIGKQVYRWKAKLHELRQIVEPQENVIKMIAHSDFPFVDEESGFFFQDLKENFSRVTSALDMFKETLNGVFNLQISLKADHTNAIMKTLTLVSVIFIPMTFIAGLYGMNFEFMPELKMRFGYFYVLAFMFIIGGTIATYFYVKGWWGHRKN